jgi:hypothetical protein
MKDTKNDYFRKIAKGIKYIYRGNTATIQYTQ